MKKTNIYIKLIASALLVIMLLSMLSSCAADPMDNTKIGTVGDEDVYYDELYYIVENYKDYVKTLYPDSEAAQKTALDDFFKKNVIRPHAIMALCEQHGLSLKNVTSNEIDAYINDYYNGGQDNFDEQLEANHMSERFLEYLAATEILYTQKLPAKLIDEGIITYSGNELKTYIKEKFIRVNHLVIINDEGDDPAKNYAKIKEAKGLLDKGVSIDTLIGKGYSEDFSDISGNGYYIAKGTRSETYEKVAFSLDINEISDVFTDIGESNTGVKAECYRIVQRLKMDDKYIDSHIAELEDKYHASIMYPLLEKEMEKLSFTPNASYNNFDLLTLKRPTNGTATLIAIIVIIVIILIIAAIVVVIIIKKNLKKKNASHVQQGKKRNK